MRNILALILSLLPVLSTAQDWEDRKVFKGATATQTLRILSSTDTVFFGPIITGFLADNPAWSVEYFVTGTAEVTERFEATPDAFDIVISSAMDLQLKLVNDGLALEVDGVDHPDWAQWRQRLFAFTSEPATIVINRAAFDGKAIPKTRQELIQVLRSAPETFRGKLGTYDIRQSGLGYLFATQDARASETFWRLMEVMGSLDAKLYCCSGDMIDDVASGKLLVAYNVLGSYAVSRQENDKRFEIIQPSDFPTTMMRTGFVSKHSPHPDAASDFLRYMIKVQTAVSSDGNYPLPPLELNPSGASPLIISLEPALMTYLDRLKKSLFVKEWTNAVVQ